VELVELFFTVVVPVGLVLMMTGMGLALSPADLKNVIVFPKAAAIGLGGQLLLLPLISFLLAVLLAPTPAVAVGAVILAACPGGVTSNGFVFASRGDLALSITLTAVTSILTVFTIPLLTALAMVSRLPYTHVMNRYLRDNAKVGTIAMYVIVALLLLIVPQWTLALGFVAYALSAPAWWVYKRVARAA